MLILLASPDAVLRDGLPDPDLVEVLKQVKAMSYPVALVSNNPEPKWFDNSFHGSGVQFLQQRGRQDGKIVSFNAGKFGLQPFNVLVLAAKDLDVQMGKNGKALLVAAGWSSSSQVKALGIQVTDAQQLQEVIALSGGWPGDWWFSGAMPRYKICALADLSTYGKSNPQQLFAKKLTATAKQGGVRLTALLAVTARSLLMDGIGVESDLLWGVYPSSASGNDDQEILSDFTHRLRTTVSRVRFAQRGEPLFIRHKQSLKRSGNRAANRTNPADQIETIHLNPYYETRLPGRHVVVIDDCTTYGVSFGAAAAFLRRAGAASVSGVALGKFGNQLGYYEIDLQSDPYSPVSATGYSGAVRYSDFQGVTSSASQGSLQTLIP